MRKRTVWLAYGWWIGGAVALVLAVGLMVLMLRHTPAASVRALTIKRESKPGLLSLQVGSSAGEAQSALPVAVSDDGARTFRWSADGGYLAYERDGDLFIYDRQSGEQRNLTNTPNRWEMAPAWSPDGQRLAFLSRPLEPAEGQPSKPGAGAWVRHGCACGSPTLVGRDGSGYRVLAEGKGANAPAWAPDGQRLAYEQDGTVYLYQMAAQQAEPLNPAAYGWAAAYVGAPSWSPDGEELALYFAAEGGKQQGYVALQLKQKSARPLYRYEAPFVARGPALWSTDGARLALLFGVEGPVGEPLGTWVVDRRGERAVSVAGQPYQAAWEPSGERLAVIEAGDMGQIKLLSPSAAGWQEERRQVDGPLQGFAWWSAGR